MMLSKLPNLQLKTEWSSQQLHVHWAQCCNFFASPVLWWATSCITYCLIHLIIFHVDQPFLPHELSIHSYRFCVGNVLIQIGRVWLTFFWLVKLLKISLVQWRIIMCTTEDSKILLPLITPSMATKLTKTWIFQLRFGSFRACNN